MLYSQIAAPFIPHLSGEDSGTHALALAILLDQFPRNLFRGPAQAVVYTHYDRISRAVAAEIRARGLDCFVETPVWRVWFYICLEHSEAVADHELLRVKLESMMSGKDQIGARFVEKVLEFEKRHLEPLKQFGRFPWRNRWLGRESTEAEKKWLDAGGDTFGT